MPGIFPTLNGQNWDIVKNPKWATRKQTSVSGRQTVLVDQPLPIWEFTISYDKLKDPNDTRGGAGLGTGSQELRTLMGFYLACQGSFLPFLFSDPSDNFIASQFLGTGDGTTTQFQLIRTMTGGGLTFNEPIVAPNTLGAVLVNGVSAPFSMNTSTGIVTMTTPPANLATVFAQNFAYYFRCRFSEDSQEFSNFAYQLWEVKQMKLMSILL